MKLHHLVNQHKTAENKHLAELGKSLAQPVIEAKIEPEDTPIKKPVTAISVDDDKLDSAVHILTQGIPGAHRKIKHHD